MKICEKCNQEFDDSLAFCPNCGTRLVASPVPVQDNGKNLAEAENKEIIGSYKKGNSGGFWAYFKAYAEKWDNSPKLLVRWLPLILAVMAFVVSWEVSSTFGVVFGLFAVFTGAFSNNIINKILSILIGGITVIISVIAVFY